MAFSIPFCPRVRTGRHRRGKRKGWGRGGAARAAAGAQGTVTGWPQGIPSDARGGGSQGAGACRKQEDPLDLPPPSPLSASPNWPPGPKFIVSFLEGREHTDPFLRGEGALSHFKGPLPLPPSLPGQERGPGSPRLGLPHWRRQRSPADLVQRVHTADSHPGLLPLGRPPPP